MAAVASLWACHPAEPPGARPPLVEVGSDTSVVMAPGVPEKRPRADPLASLRRQYPILAEYDAYPRVHGMARLMTDLFDAKQLFIATGPSCALFSPPGADREATVEICTRQQGGATTTCVARATLDPARRAIEIDSPSCTRIDPHGTTSRWATGSAHRPSYDLIAVADTHATLALRETIGAAYDSDWHKVKQSVEPCLADTAGKPYAAMHAAGLSFTDVNVQQRLVNVYGLTTPDDAFRTCPRATSVGLAVRHRGVGRGRFVKKSRVAVDCAKPCASAALGERFVALDAQLRDYWFVHKANRGRVLLHPTREACEALVVSPHLDEAACVAK